MVLFGLIIVAMLAATVQATLDRGVLEALDELWPDPWFRATLADAYFGFLTVFVWIAYRERSMIARLLWFVALMLLGNFAIAAYILVALYQLDPAASLEKLLLRKEY